MHGGDFHPCHHAMQTTSTRRPSLSSINEAGKMFPVPLKMSFFEAKLLQILIVLGWKDIYLPSQESHPFMNTKTSVYHQQFQEGNQILL